MRFLSDDGKLFNTMAECDTYENELKAKEVAERKRQEELERKKNEEENMRRSLLEKRDERLDSIVLALDDLCVKLVDFKNDYGVMPEFNSYLSQKLFVETIRSGYNNR